MSPVISAAAEVLEIILVLVGLALLWRDVISPAARARPRVSPLPKWEAMPSDFLIFLLFVTLGTFLFAAAAGSVLRFFPLHGDAAALAGGAGAQFGMLAGVLAYGYLSRSYRAQAPQPITRVLKSGLFTFAITVPILVGTSKAWETLLALFGIPAERQDLIRMFAQAKSPVLVVSLIVLATVIAPVTEEMVFRAGVFRFLRSRAPRALALLVPALIFASLHVNWPTLEGFASFAPLLVLALVFSLAYERTGHIGTTIVAHALFNLNTIILIYCGVGA